MLSSFRNLSKSKVGTVILALFVLAIVASFALADITGFGGRLRREQRHAGQGRRRAGHRARLQRPAMERRLADARQQNPEADYASHRRRLRPDCSTQLIQRRARSRPSRATSDLLVSKRAGRCRDRQPAADARARRQVQRRRPMPQFLQQQRLTDADRAPTARQRDLAQRLLLAPVAANAARPGRGRDALCLDAARSSARARSAFVADRQRSAPA